MSSADGSDPPPDGFDSGGLPGDGRREARRRLVVGVLVGIFFVLLIAPAVLLVRQYVIQRDIDTYLRREESWAMYRTKVEYEAVRTALAEVEAADAGADRAPVRTAIDVLYNRIQILRGPMGGKGFADLPSFDTTIAALYRLVEEADAILNRGDGPLSPSELAALREVVQRGGAPVNALIREAVIDYARERDEIRARAEDEIIWNAVAMAALLAASALFIGALAWYVGQLTRAGDGLKRMAGALQQSEGRLRLIADNLPMLISYADAARRVLFVNRTGERWAGSPAGGIVGGRIAALFDAESYQQVSASIGRAIAGHLAQFEGSLLFPDGVRRIVEVSFIPDFAADDPDLAEGARVRGFFVMMIDVTARRESEEQLRQALKMEAVGRLTGGVAHDFNNLLGIIVGNLDLASLELADRPAERSLIDRAIGAAERGASLTQRLLAFSRKQTLLPRLTDVNRLVIDLSDMLVRTLGETIEVVPELAREPCLSRIDPNQLEAAILNLAVNARDAMPAGGRLTIATMTSDAASGRGAESEGEVIVAISDTGTGMAPEVVGRAFEPFFTTKEVGKGSGLGLSMVFGFVKQSGGHVVIESEPGFGTTVRLYLPRARGAGDAAREAPPPPAAAGRGRLVLVVEDNREMLAFSVGALNRLGYRTVQAEAAAAALETLSREPEVSVLFTDVVLPGGMDGLSLAREAQRRWPGLRVLFTSGFAGGGRREGEEDAGGAVAMPAGAEVLIKPFRVSDLSRHLERLLVAETV